jgi:hypothetical protein
MNIHAVGGDILELAPALAEVSALWLRKGYCERHVTWERILERYRPGGPLVVHLLPVDSWKEPWLSPSDRQCRLVPPNNKLKLLYVFSNPKDAQCLPDLDTLRTLIRRCLDRISRLGYRCVAMIHIPAAVDGHVNDAVSADVLIEAIRSWDEKHPGMIDDVFLVDRKNDFSKQL